MGRVMGLQGSAKVGKDTVADYLVSSCGWGKKVSFADNLKTMCQAVFFLSEDDVTSQAGKERVFDTPIVLTGRNLGSIFYWMSQTHRDHPIKKGSKEKVNALVGTKLNTPRHVLQFVGTDICREVIPSYHLDVMVGLLEASPETDFVITDIRFPNEGDLVLEEFSGTVVNILRDPPPKELIDRSHLSETAMSSWGKFSDSIDNTKDGLQFLYAEVNNLLKRRGLCQEETTLSLSVPRVNTFPTKATGALNATGTIKITSSTDDVSE